MSDVFVRTSESPTLPPPFSEKGPVAWARKNLFATPFDTALSLMAILFLAWLLPPLFVWLFVDAQWTGTDRTFCTTAAQGGIQEDGWSGACWAFVGAKFQQFLVGRYPDAERWRVWLTGALFVVLLIPLAMPKLPRTINPIHLTYCTYNGRSSPYCCRIPSACS